MCVLGWVGVMCSVDFFFFFSLCGLLLGGLRLARARARPEVSAEVVTAQQRSVVVPPRRAC